MTDFILCPTCSTQIPLSEAVAKLVESELQARFAADLKERVAEARAQATAEAERALQQKNEELASLEQKVAQVTAQEAELLRRARQLDEREQQAALEVERQLSAERDRQRKTMEATFEERVRIVAEQRNQETAKLLVDGQAELRALRESLAKTAEREAELMQRHREAEARSTQRALEAKADAERQAKAAALAADRAFAAKLKEREEEVERANQRVAQATAQEAELARRARQLDEREERSKLELERQLAEESERQRKVQNATFEERVRVMAEEKSREAAQQLAQGQAELRALRESLTKTIEREAELVRRQRELEEREAQRAADVERRITEERARERRVAEMRVGEQLAQQQAQAELREVEYKRTIEGLQKEMTQVQQRLTQGSQQAQGEAQEEALHAVLSRTCPRDELDEVPIGKAGADLLQTVMENGRVCGKVLWESKRTKAWSDEWLPKLRDDQQASGAEWSVLVTQALPSDVKTFALKDGVWVCSWLHVAPFVTLLRSAVVQVATARSVVEGHTDKVHLLYRYMTGPSSAGGSRACSRPSRR